MPPKKRPSTPAATAPESAPETASAPAKKLARKKAPALKLTPPTPAAPQPKKPPAPRIEAHTLENSGGPEVKVHFYRNIALGFLLVTLVLFGAVLLLTLKRATITIMTRPTLIEADALLDVTPERTGLNTIPGKVTEWDETFEKQFKPSTVREEPAVAEGRVTIINKSGRVQPLVATTRLLTPEGLLFRLKRAVTVPPEGLVDAEMYADQKGASYNIPPTRFTIPGLSPVQQEKVYAESAVATEGGVRAIGIVGEDDVRAAEETWKTQFAEFVNEKARMVLSQFSGLKVQMDNLTLAGDKAVGSEVDTFTITGKARIIAVGFDERELKEFARAKLKERAGKTVLRLDVPETLPEIEIESAGSEKARILVHLKGALHLDASHAAVSPAVFAGKGATQIKEYLGGVPGIDAVTISFFPAWLKNAPSNTKKITVNVNEER